MADRDTVEFRNADGRSVPGCRSLLAFDRTGREFPSEMVLDTSGPRPVITLRGETGEAEFPVTIDPFSDTQEGSNCIPSDAAPRGLLRRLLRRTRRPRRHRCPLKVSGQED